MGSDQYRKLAIAQSRYMDKQCLTPFSLKELTAATAGQRPTALFQQPQQQSFLPPSHALKSSAETTTPALDHDLIRNGGDVSLNQKL